MVSLNSFLKAKWKSAAYLYKMAATKKSPTKSKTATTYDKEYADKLKQESYDQGIDAGQQQVYAGVVAFLQQRMNTYFELRQDELAKECREILTLIKPNLKQNT